MVNNAEKYVAFLPCRKGSERVKEKNTRKFADIDGGLISIKLKQLLLTEEIDEIFLSSDDEQILEYAHQLKSGKIIIDERDKNLCSSTTSTDNLIEYAGFKIHDGTILWTHVTSPFVTARVYRDAIKLYEKNVLNGAHDSLMTVNTIHKFLWNSTKPINYDRNIEKWPRTQTLPALYEVNSAIFMAKSSIYKDLKDRIGSSPYLMPLHDLIAFDIDWEENWIIAEQMYLKNISRI